MIMYHSTEDCNQSFGNQTDFPYINIIKPVESHSTKVALLNVNFLK